MTKMEKQIYDLERNILKTVYPNLHPSTYKRFHKLLLSKNVQIINTPELDNILCSIFRHDDTNYDTLLREVGKEKARGILYPVISKKLKLASNR